MAVVNAIEESVIFARDIDPEVNARLQQAVACAQDFERARDLMLEAMRIDQDQLAVHIALYKFYFYRGYLAESEEVVRDALQRAARQAGIATDWRELDPASCDWRQPESPQRVYLYSLKALSFIRLRREDAIQARTILGKLAELDPDDLVGASVIAALADSLDEAAA